MWNPIVSGSTDLWQHVWMYYSMPVEAWAAGGWTELHASQTGGKRNNLSTCPSKMQRAEVHRQKQQLFSVMAHYATYWNLESIHRAELWLWAKAAVQRIKLSDPCRVTLRFCWADPVAVLTFMFIAVMLNQHPWELGLFIYTSTSITSLNTKRSSLRHKPWC